MLLSRILERVAREDGPKILAGLIRLAGDFDAGEDALQEAYARALVAWRREGVPQSPGAWLNTVARRVAIDRIRRDRTTALPADLLAETPPPGDFSGIEDDRLRLLFTCCHPALAPDARCALALRSLGGLTTREIARGFVEPEATTAQRLVRAKRKIREAGIPYEVPPRRRLAERVETVLSVLYLIFNEAHTATDAPGLTRPDLAREAIRLGRLVVELLPGEPEAEGLLALMLLTDARRAARVDALGDLVTLDEQERARWDSAAIGEGTAILDRALARGRPGPYQIQAAIAALHAAAGQAHETDWRQIAALYGALLEHTPTPVVALNAAVALGMAGELEPALAWIDRIDGTGELARYHLLFAARADLLRRLGRLEQAAGEYRRALDLVTNPAEARFLERRLSQVLALRREESRSA